MSAVPHHSGWQADFLTLLPTVQSQANLHFRGLPAERRADAVQEAIACACVSYQQLVVQGRLHVAHPSTLAKFAIRFARAGRHVGGHQDKAKDVLSPACQRQGRVRVVSTHVPQVDGDSSDWKPLAVADRKASIPDTAAFRIDFEQWLSTLPRRDRRIIAMLITGEQSRVVAKRCAMSAGRISQLRKRYERQWQAFHGESPAAVRG
jgi:hypothetical protein